MKGHLAMTRAFCAQDVEDTSSKPRAYPLSRQGLRHFRVREDDTAVLQSIVGDGDLVADRQFKSGIDDLFGQFDAYLPATVICCRGCALDYRRNDPSARPLCRANAQFYGLRAPGRHPPG